MAFGHFGLASRVVMPLRAAELNVSPQQGGPMTYRHITTALMALAAALHASGALAQHSESTPAVHIIWMGGADCPPCVVWRREELPKLKASMEFARVKFTYVDKVVQSAVPPRFFLPEEVKRYKEKLDEASSGRRGSPQAAIIVNGEVYDYFHGTRSAEEFERMLAAIRMGREYPFKRCLKISTEWKRCEIAG